MNTNHRQRGTALVTSLLLLLVLTVIGVTAMQMTRMEERMAGNTRDLNLAFQGAEAALRNGEDMIFAEAFPPTTCSTAPCPFWTENSSAVANPETHDWKSGWWISNATTEYQASGNHTISTRDMPSLAADPSFVVEYVTDVPDSLTRGDGLPSARYFYQVSAASPGATDSALTVLQSTYARR